MTDKKEWIPQWQKIRVTYLIPLCCGEKMVRYSGGPGRDRYFRCQKCGCTGRGSMIREVL